MSTIEERLSRDIEAVTEGIVVTEPDLQVARRETDERIRGARQQHRRRGVVAAAAAAAVAVGVAAWQGLPGDDVGPSPAPPAPSASEPPDEAFLVGDAPTMEGLEGMWRLDNPTTSNLLVRFTADGDVAFDDTGELTGNPLVAGTYDVEGDTITVAVEAGTAQCAGQSITLRAVVSATGPLHMVPVGLDLGECGTPERPRWVIEQVLPVTEAMAILKVGPGKGWSSIVGRQVVATWYDPTGGYIVELRPDGSYVVLADAAQILDAGTWVDEESSTRLVMTSSESPSCREGDRFVLGGLRAREVGTIAVQGDVERNDCGLPWSGNGWFRLAG